MRADGRAALARGRATLAGSRSALARSAAAALIASTCLSTSAVAVAHGATARASLPQIERQVMCVTCKIPLEVAESPQADRERAFIQGLIDEGENEAAIKRALVGQYGPAVLALPSASGFDLAAYLVPLAAVLVLLAALAVLLPRWRRRARAQALAGAPSPSLTAADAQRLDADLERFD
ncbi:MAG TPA: cytochrome c-type biogenesis protein CcmH [Solirubrobacteraceae bacterium]|jgi:cytochrome c-type biogenesis protein CcmH|nr:cytochrome c-type biogenesis protein CcmH [Solirubrobacteraceae bacterium]